MAAGLRPPRLGTPGAPAAARGAWIRRRRAARQGRGSFGAPDLSRNAAGLGHPNRSCSRSPGAGRRRERGGGSGREGGARAAGIQGQPGRSRRRHAGPADRQSEAPGAPARAEAGRGRERAAGPEGLRATAPALGQGVPARGRLRSSPGARAARAGRAGRLGRRRGWGCARPGRGPAPPPGRLFAAQCGAGPQPGSPQARPRVVLSFEVRLLLSLAPEPRGPAPP